MIFDFMSEVPWRTTSPLDLRFVLARKLILKLGRCLASGGGTLGVNMPTPSMGLESLHVFPTHI